jgi:hypothetical protein
LDFIAIGLALMSVSAVLHELIDTRILRAEAASMDGRRDQARSMEGNVQVPSRISGRGR